MKFGFKRYQPVAFLFGAIAFSGLAVFFVWVLYSHVLVLVVRGETGEATVIEEHRHKCGKRRNRTCWKHSFTLTAFPGRTFKAALGKSSSQLPYRLVVTYDPQNPNTARPGPPPTLANLSVVEWIGLLSVPGMTGLSIWCLLAYFFYSPRNRTSQL